MLTAAARTSGPGLGSMGSLLLRRQPARGFDGSPDFHVDSFIADFLLKTDFRVESA